VFLIVSLVASMVLTLHIWSHVSEQPRRRQRRIMRLHPSDQTSKRLVDGAASPGTTLHSNQPLLISRNYLWCNWVKEWSRKCFLLLEFFVHLICWLAVAAPSHKSEQDGEQDLGLSKNATFRAIQPSSQLLRHIDDHVCRFAVF
jgi:hypothetical protein